MNSDSPSNVTRNELTNLIFALGYSHHYRYYRSKILENDIDGIDKVLSSLKEQQVESIVSVLRVELVTNSVMYCEDLAIILLALNKPTTEIIKTIASLHETGAGSVKEFYEKFPQRNFEYFWRMIKYDRFCEEKEVDKYQRSCKRFANDMLGVSKFFLHWYELFSAYKHGLNIVPLVDAGTGKDVLMIGKYDGTFDTLVLRPSWYIGYIEIVEIVHNIFNKVIDPIIWKMLEDIAGVNLKDEKTIRKMLTSIEPEDKTRPFGLTMKVTFPWKIRETKEYRPFY